MCSAHRSGLIDSAALIRQLHAYLDDDAPPSLREIARRIGVSVGALRHHAPAIVKRLADSRRSHLRTARRAKKQAALVAVRNGVRHWSKLHSSPIARKSLLKSLMKETGLPKELLRKAIRQELKDQVA
jgi:AcrR family transcriptional regulator